MNWEGWFSKMKTTKKKANKTSASSVGASKAKTSSKKVAVAPKKVATTSKKVAAKTASPKKASADVGSGRRIGIFGGSFNPFHNGHISSLREVLKLAKLDCIYVVPSNQNPLKVLTDGPSGKERLDMVKLGV